MTKIPVDLESFQSPTSESSFQGPGLEAAACGSSSRAIADIHGIYNAVQCKSHVSCGYFCKKNKM